MKTSLLAFLLIPAASTRLLAEELPAWAGRAPNGDPVRIAIASPQTDTRFQHLAWPKAVRVADGTIVLGCLMGRRHVGENCPAVSISTDDGKTFSAPKLLREFGEGRDYGASGNMALGLAHDGSVLLLAHGYSEASNHIFGWRSTDSGRTWAEVDTSALGPNKTGSSTGHLAQLPGRRLMVVGHYRRGSSPHSFGIWSSISADDGLIWGAPSLVMAEQAAVEPVVVRHRDRLLIFIRDKSGSRQWIAVSDDWGGTWKTSVASFAPLLPTTTSIAHPFAMVDPHHPEGLLAVTFERGRTGAAQLWRGNPRTLEFKHERTLVELPAENRAGRDDFGYPWLVPLESRRALLFYYHGQADGRSSIWLLETEI